MVGKQVMVEASPTSILATRMRDDYEIKESSLRLEDRYSDLYSIYTVLKYIRNFVPHNIC